MSEETDKFKLWKVYGILMGVMLGGSTLFLGGQAAWNAWRENTGSSSMSVTLKPSVTPVASLPTLKPDKEKPSTSLALTTPRNEVSIPREQTTTKAQASPVNRDFNAEVFDPPSNCRIRPEANSSVKQVLQKGDVLVDRNNPQTDSKGEFWYREQYLGCWLHNSQIRFK